jgi:hypothetical protein
MKNNLFRIVSVISSAFLLVAVVFSFFASPYVGSAYLQVTSRLGSALPLITKDFSLAFLGNSKDPFSTFSERAVWAWCLWLILLCCPIALIIWAVRALDFERSLAKWCLCVIAYLSALAAVTVIGIIGMILPFMNL